MKQNDTFEIGKQDLSQSAMLQTSDFCQTPDKFQSETELSKEQDKKAWMEKDRTG